MQCGDRPLRALPARADARLPRRAGLPVERARAVAARSGSSDGGAEKQTLAVWKFSSCDGCQLSLLDCEDELLTLAERRRARLLPRGDARDRRGPVRRLARRGLDHDAARRRADPRGPPAVARARHDRRVRDGRRHPGAAQLRRRRRLHRRSSTPRRTTSARWPRRRRSARTCRSTSSSTAARSTSASCSRSSTPTSTAGARACAPHSVCVECKRRGTVCVTVAHGTPCLGPVTHAGCGALCPAYHRGCYGCFGPMETPNTAALSAAHGRARVRRRRPRPRLPDLQRGRPRRSRRRPTRHERE